MITGFKGVVPKIADSVFVADSASIIGDVEIGDDSSVWFNSVIRGDVSHIKIGRRTNIQDNSTIHVTKDPNRPTIIGDDVTIGHMVVIHAAKILGRALIGIGSIIMDESLLEENVIVGAGSLVTGGSIVPSGSLLWGRPAKVIRSLRDDEIKKISLLAQNYIDYKNVYMGR